MIYFIKGCLIGLVSFFLLICVISLVPIPIHKEPELVATKDNCNVYRYYDKGNRLYFTACDKK